MYDMIGSSKKKKRVLLHAASTSIHGRNEILEPATACMRICIYRAWRYCRGVFWMESPLSCGPSLSGFGIRVKDGHERGRLD
jgi:hypothetical protein